MRRKTQALTVNAALNVMKQVCSIIFPMITFPYASRVLGAEIYGKINFSASIVSYISLLAALGINNYAIREGARVRGDKSAFGKLVNEIFSMNLILTMGAYFVLAVLMLFVPTIRALNVLLLIQSLTVFFTTIGTDWINVIFEDYLYITVRYITSQSIAVVLMLLLVKKQNDYLLYAVSSVCSVILANILNFFYIRKKLNLHIQFTWHVNMKTHFKPVIIMFGGSVASFIYINSDITLLGLIKDNITVGYYSVSAKIYSLVKQIINAALIVLIPRISFEISSGKQDKVINKLSVILNVMILLIVPACIGLYMLSGNIVILISGTQYLPSCSSLMILSVALLFASTACFYVHVVMIPFRMESKVFFATSISALTNICLNIVLIPFWGQNAAAFTTVISEILIFVCGYIFSRKLVQIRYNKSILVSVIEGIAIYIICTICQILFRENILVILISILVSVCACILIVMIGYINEIRCFVTNKHRNVKE